MTLRIAFDLTPTLGTRTGIGNVVAHLLEALSEIDDLELAPYTLSYKAKSYKSDLPSNNTFISVPARVLLNAWKYSNIFSLDNQVVDIDVWHATNYLAPPTSKPLIITIHDVTMVKYPDLVSSQVRSLAPMISRRLKAGAHIQVPAEAIKEDALEFFGNDISDKSHVHVVPFSAPDLLDAEPSARIKDIAEGDPYILCIGALEPRKNHTRLIEAFEIISSKNPHIRLFLVGPDGPARASIDDAMSKLSHEARSHVVIAGPVNDADRTYLLKNAHLVAYPSLYEGFGLPLLEAMTAHTPIVTTKEGSLEEIAGNAALFVDAYDSDDIARGIIDVLESNETRDKLVAAGKKRINDFSWQKSASMLADLYKSIAKSKEL